MEILSDFVLTFHLNNNNSSFSMFVDQMFVWHIYANGHNVHAMLRLQIWTNLIVIHLTVHSIGLQAFYMNTAEELHSAFGSLLWPCIKRALSKSHWLAAV